MPSVLTAIRIWSRTKKRISIHRLAQGNCTTCHHPHGSGYIANLKQALPDLCLSCHDVDHDWATGVAHEPARQGQCTACHNVHQSDRPHLLTMDVGPSLSTMP